MKTRKLSNIIYVSRNTFNNQVDLFLIREKAKDTKFLSETFILHRGRNDFRRYYLETFSREEMPKCHIND